MANIVSVERVSKRHAEKQVLTDVTLGIAERDRIGVIGVNGSGKSTLLRIVARDIEPDAGRVVHRDGLRMRFVPQDPRLDDSLTAGAAALSVPATFDPLVDRAAVQREARATAVLDRLGIDDAQVRVDTLSGGQRKRVALAAALVDPVDLLILDEPTNHLDVDVVEWLEGELKALPTALLLVTHDRYLLDRVATRIVEVHNGDLHTAHGSYKDYLDARVLRDEQAAATQRRRANAARVELAWLRRGAQARTSKAKYRVARAQDLLASMDQPDTPGMQIELPSRRLGTKVIELHNAGKRYGDRIIVAGVDWKLKPGERAGIVGPNGAGKTTLLRLLAGELAPDTGKVVVGDTVHVGWYGQDPRRLPPNQRVVDAVSDVVRETRLMTGRTASAGELCEHFLFDGAAQKARVRELSGGERRRLELLLVLAQAPNVLLLDEPTNDLDLDTLEVLEDYLDTWSGVLVVATHDRFFLDRVCEDLYALEQGGVVRHHPGGWTSWRAEVAAAAQAQGQAPASTTRAEWETQKRHRRARKLSDSERRELGRLERALVRLEQERDDLSASLAAGGDYERVAALGSRLTAVLAEIDAAETRWLELSEIKERA